MMGSSIVSFARALLLSASCSAVCVAEVLVVDFAGGGDFSDLQVAVDAADDGDVLLVQPGVYQTVILDARSLHVIGDGENVFVTGPITVRNTTADQRVTLAGLTVLPQLPPGAPPAAIAGQPAALTVRDCDGAVNIERCEVRAISLEVGSGTCERFMSWPPGRDAVLVQSSAQVIVEGSLFVGGYGVDAGGDLLCLDQGSRGGRGLVVEHGRVDLHDVIVRGGAGAAQGYGGIGGNAVEVRAGSDVLLSGVVAEGGDGGDSYDFIGGPPIGNGGHGVFVEIGGVVRTVGGLATGGEPGFTCCWFNDPGEDQLIQGVLVPYAGQPHRFLTDSPAREGELLTLSLTGSVGDSAFLFMGFGPLALIKPGFAGAVYVAPPFVFGPAPLAPLGAGITAYQLPVPELGPGFDALVVDMQVFVQEGAGPKHLTGPAVVVLLDGSL